MCCVSHCKDTKLKAIHNHEWQYNTEISVVFHTAKIQNWKQFTTAAGELYAFCVVFHTAKIQNWKQFTTYNLTLTKEE